jgi:L-fucono-1,5-lactonase
MTDRSRVDAHHHFWDPARASYPWMTPDLAPIARAFGPDDLAPRLDAAGIGRTIVIQARASVDETRDLLGIAAGSPFVAGVVGWVDLTDPAIGDVLGALGTSAGGERLVGVRHQVHDEPDPDWLLRADVRRGLEAVAGAGLVFDLLVRPRELPAALTIVRAMPDLRFVIDHLAKPPIRDGALEPWATLIRPFGGLANAWAKVSGLVTEADWKAWRIEDLAPYVRHATDVFTAGRLIFGSDWPVCILAAPYRRVVASARALSAGFTDAERESFFGGTASRVYRLDAAE